MKPKSQSKNNSQYENRKYLVTRNSLDGIPTVMGVWINEVSGFSYQPHMIGIKRYNGETIWVRDTDEEVHQLIRDRDRMLEHQRRAGLLYEEHLREQRYGKR